MTDIPAAIQTPTVREIERANAYLSVPLFIIFSLSVFFPSANQLLKLPFFGMAVLSSACFALYCNGHLFLHRATVLWCAFYVVIGLLWVELGLAWRAPGAIAVSTVYVLWPLVYLLFINQLNSVKLIRRLSLVFMIVAALGVVAELGFILQALGVIPGVIFSQILGSGNGFGMRSGSPAYSSTRVAVFLFIVPLCFSVIMHRWPARKGVGLLIYSWTMLIVSIILIVIAQRRSVWVITFLAPFIAFATEMMMRPPPGPRRSRSYQFLFAGVVVVALIFYMWTAGYFDYMDWDAIQKRFAQGFDFSGNVVSTDRDANARGLQSRALFAGWLDSPMFGSGHGAVVGVVRSIDTPWAYELTYLALLFQTGTLGFLIYACGVMWTLYHLVVIVRDPQSPLRFIALAMLNGTIGFLIGSATNPYLLSFDYLWVLFIPLAVINLELVRISKGMQT